VAKIEQVKLNMNYYSGIHTSAGPSNFTPRKCVELTPATRTRMDEAIPAVVRIMFKIKYLRNCTKQAIPSQEISSKIN
jgi:hypothetical protein